MRLSPVRIALAYVAMAALWILLSDSIAAALVSDRETLSAVSMVKGWAFVATTGTVLLLLVRRYAASLRATADRARILFEHNAIAMMVVDPATRRIIDANAAASALLRRPRDVLIGMSDRDLVEPDMERQGVRADAVPLSDLPVRIRLPDGTNLEVVVGVDEVPIEERPTWLISLQDLSQRRDEERRRQRFADRLGLLHAVDLAVLSTDGTGALAAGAAARIRELIAADRVSVVTFDLHRGIAHLIAVSDPSGTGATVGATAPIEEIATAEWLAAPTVVSSDQLQGAPVVAPSQRFAQAMGHESHVIAPLVAGGGLLGQISVGSRRTSAFSDEDREITEEVARVLAIAIRQGQLRESVEASEHRFRLLFDASPNPILLVDATGIVRFANEPVRAVFGIGADELIGLPIETVIPVDRQEHHAELRRAFSRQGERRPHGRPDLVARRADGSVFPVDVALMPVDLPDGPMVVATVVDLTERAALETQLLQAQKMEVMGRFANILAHDFRNYLTAIGGFAALLADALPEDDVRRLDAVEISEVVDRASDLVRNVLAFARPESGRITVTSVPRHLNSVSGMLRRLLAPGMRLQFRVPPELPMVAIDNALLTQVLVNLVTNARDAMGRDGTLEIAAEAFDHSAPAEASTEVAVADGGAAEDDMTGPAAVQVPSGPRRGVRIRIRDTGAGMDEATRRRIFEPFFSTKPQGDGPGAGTGLGLSSVYTIITRAAGRIDVESTVGGGTTFIIDLPMSV